MATTLNCLDSTDFALLLQQAPPRRRISSVHLHHTGAPSQAQWRGEASLLALRQLHGVERGQGDLAQHLTIDPAGALWLGRDWELPPASCAAAVKDGAQPWNGDTQEGPFMVVLVGNFDDRKDKLAGPQEKVLVDVVALLLCHAGKGSDGWIPVLSHAQMHGSGTQCPGTSLTVQHDKSNRLDQALLDKFAKRATELAASAADPPLPLQQLPPSLRAAVAAGRERAVHAVPRAPALALEIPEDHAARVTAAELARNLAGAGSGSRGAIDPRYAPLFGHVVNTARGLLLESPAQEGKAGSFFTSQDELEQGFFNKLDQHERLLAPDAVLHILIHAHGGLVNENDSLDYALAHQPWWQQGLSIFPFFMTWESGLIESLLRNKRELDGSRGLGDWLIEKTAGPLARMLWDRMKINAELCSAADWHAGFRRLEDEAPPARVPRGVAGGARLFALALCARLGEYTRRRKVQLHALGHSAGSIYHCHFLPLLLELIQQRNLGAGVSVESLHLLAPAVRLDTFEDHLAAPIARHDIRQTWLYTMDDKRERDDNVAWIYRKSLLYFVDEACERNNPGILGMASYLEKERARAGSPIARAFPPGATVPGHVDFSDGGRRLHVTESRKHGDFDNDPATMNSIAARILGHALPEPKQYRRWIPASNKKPAAQALSNPATPPRAAAAGGQRLALCVGIDAYPSAPLSGCVSDSRSWGEALQALGFSVRYLHDAAATRANLAARIAELVREARSGDWLVLQIASHGTVFDDVSGDESSGSDQAVVPVDFRDNGCLLDDELQQLLRPLPAGAQLTLFFDLCHSLSASRFAPALSRAVGVDERVRLLPADAQMYAVRARQREAAPRRRRADTPVDWLHLAACQDSEYAYETNASGDFTRCAVPLLARAAAEGWSAAAFVNAVQRTFPPGSRQNPGLMPGCNPQRRLLPGLAGAAAVQDRRGELARIAQLLEQAASGLRALQS